MRTRAKGRAVRVVLGIISVLFVALAGATPALASTSWIMSGGRATTTAGAALVGYGVYGESYVYDASAAVYDQKVNSVYAQTLAGSFVEGGWIRDPAVNGPWLFMRYSNVNTGLGDEQYFEWYPVDNTWHSIRLSQHTPLSGTQTYDFYADAQYTFGMSNTGVTSSYADLGSERYDTLEVNKMSLRQCQYLKKTSSTTTAWTFWSDLRPTNPSTNPPFNDLTYEVYNNKINTSIHKAYIDDHQN